MQWKLILYCNMQNLVFSFSNLRLHTIGRMAFLKEGHALILQFFYIPNHVIWNEVFSFLHILQFIRNRQKLYYLSISILSSYKLCIVLEEFHNSYSTMIVILSLLSLSISDLPPCRQNYTIYLSVFPLRGYLLSYSDYTLMSCQKQLQLHGIEFFLFRVIQR